MLFVIGKLRVSVLVALEVSIFLCKMIEHQNVCTVTLERLSISVYDGIIRKVSFIIM